MINYWNGRRLVDSNTGKLNDFGIFLAIDTQKSEIYISICRICVILIGGKGKTFV